MAITRSPKRGWAFYLALRGRFRSDSCRGRRDLCFELHMDITAANAKAASWASLDSASFTLPDMPDTHVVQSENWSQGAQVLKNRFSKP